MYVCMCPLKGQNVLHPLELELQAVISGPTVLGTELCSSKIAGRVLNH